MGEMNSPSSWVVLITMPFLEVCLLLTLFAENSGHCSFQLY